MQRRMIAACFVEEALDSLRRRGFATEPILAAADLPAEVREPLSAERRRAISLLRASVTESTILASVRRNNTR